MRVVHKFDAVGRCPANGKPDYHRIELHTDRLLRCEDAVAAAEALLVEPVYQEDFTQALADRLRCRVVTTCRHLDGGRVETRCECEPKGRRGAKAG